MEVRNCKSCKKLFNYVSGMLMCPSCKDALEKKFMKVKDFLREYPNTAIDEVAEINEVTTKQLKQWVREERLSFSDSSPVFLECENCGAPIKTGRFCGKCRQQLQNSFSGAIDRPKEKEIKKTKSSKSGVRFLDE
ncbi:hypothetical protein FACS1894111_12490 [Clostridia bacterium]|nr:hypothetical protein FACS1894111_12490 [Clostridia bacterium]